MSKQDRIYQALCHVKDAVELLQLADETTEAELHDEVEEVAEAQPEPVQPLEWRPGSQGILLADSRWLDDEVPLPFVLKYMGDVVWDARWESENLAHGSLQDCMDACQLYEEKEQ